MIVFYIFFNYFLKYISLLLIDNPHLLKKTEQIYKNMIIIIYILLIK